MAIRPSSFENLRKTTVSIVAMVATSCTLLSGCSHRLPPQGALYERLNNRGPVLLSSTNPYLPANRLLSEELDNSPELRDFVSQRGAPSAIQVAQGVFERTELTLIYPAEKEVYPLTKRRSGWTIGAPEPISERSLEQIEEELALGGMTLGDIVESKRYAIAMLPAAQSDNEALATEDESLATESGGDSSEEVSAHGNTARASLSLDRQGRLPVKAARNEGASTPSMGSTFHEKGRSTVSISRSGTLRHTVTLQGETLSALAMWYTGDASNLYQIAKFNKISPKKGLSLGQSINIPAKLLKNKKPLTSAHLMRISR